MRMYVLILGILFAMFALTLVVAFVVIAGKLRRDYVDRKFALLTTAAISVAHTEDSGRTALERLYYGAGIGNTFMQSALLHVFEEWERQGVFDDAEALSRIVLPSTWRTRQQLFRQLEDKDPVRRGLATALSGYTPVRLPVPVIAKVLSDPDGETALAAAAVLEHVATEESAWALIEGMASGSLPWPRIVERLPHPWALPVLIEAMQQPPDPERVDVRPWLAYATGLLGDPKAIPYIARFALDPNSEVRLNVIRALGMCAARGDRLARAYARRGARDSVEPVRNQSMTALGRIGVEADVPIVVLGLSDSGWFTRANAANALLSLGSAGRAALEDAVHHPDRYAASQAREAIARAAIAERIGRARA